MRFDRKKMRIKFTLQGYNGMFQVRLEIYADGFCISPEPFKLLVCVSVNCQNVNGFELNEDYCPCERAESWVVFVVAAVLLKLILLLWLLMLLIWQCRHRTRQHGYVWNLGLFSLLSLDMPHEHQIEYSDELFPLLCPGNVKRFCVWLSQPKNP